MKPMKCVCVCVFIMCTVCVCVYSGECMWLDMAVIQKVLEDAKNIFPVVSYAYTSVPTYPSGNIGYVLASKNKVGFGISTD